jgi:hypothetical protein
MRSEGSILEEDHGKGLMQLHSPDRWSLSTREAGHPVAGQGGVVKKLVSVALQLFDPSSRLIEDGGGLMC